MMANNMVSEGDPAFYRVDTRTPAHLLPPGVAADATNKRFDEGHPGPRHNVAQGFWGVAGANLVSGDWPGFGIGGFAVVQVTLEPGRLYYYVAGNAGTLGTGTHLQMPIPNLVKPGWFVAVADKYYLEASGVGGQSVTAQILRFGNQCGFARFNDPQGLDVMVVATDDWRNLDGEDGGRGRIWKVMANNAPVAVPLNGQDIDDTCRFIPCYNGLVLLRHGNERHYFSADAVGFDAPNQILLNGPQAWQDGDQVYLWGDPNDGSAITGASAPASGSYCFVKKVGGNAVELYADAQMSQKLEFTTATGRFYLERRSFSPGQYGNGAPPLLAQPDAAGKTLWEIGFKPVPVDLQVTNTTAADDVWTVPNHRLAPGDSVVLAGMPGGHTPANGTYYAYPLSEHKLRLFDTQAHALLAATGSTAGLADISTDGETAPTLKKTGAGGLPMPPATEGCYTANNRLVLVNGNTLLISDPLDPLHYTPMEATLNANLGESDAVVAVRHFITTDTLVILKAKSVLAIYNWSGGVNSWALRSVTHEYGCTAALSVVEWGSRLVFQSRRGLDSVEYSANGVMRPVMRPLSYDLKRYTDRLDWKQAGLACVETWSNRLFWSVPLKSAVQTTGNNAVLVLNFLNSEPDKGVLGWEGVWTGAALTPVGWARHTIAGEERLALADGRGVVSWLGDGALDVGNVAIADRLVTRLYTGTDQAEEMTARKIWNQMLVVWDTHHALLTVTAVTPGWNEETVLTPDGGLSYDPTHYAAGSNETYNPATQTPAFNTPYRDDYAIQNVTEIIGGRPDVRQNHSEPFRLREDDWAVQFVIENTRGTALIRSVTAGGFKGPSSGRSRV